MSGSRLAKSRECWWTYPGTQEMLKMRIANKPGDERVFPISQIMFRSLWYRACTELQASEIVGRPHNIRHTGPSYDTGTGP